MSNGANVGFYCLQNEYLHLLTNCIFSVLFEDSIALKSKGNCSLFTFL